MRSEGDGLETARKNADGHRQDAGHLNDDDAEHGVGEIQLEEHAPQPHRDDNARHDERREDEYLDHLLQREAVAGQRPRRRHGDDHRGEGDDKGDHQTVDPPPTATTDRSGT